MSTGRNGANVWAPTDRRTSLAGPYQLYWGDIHNHNAVGYAKGSLERSIEVAREHLDFFAFTGHAAWHDMPLMPGDRHMHWVNGFQRHTEHWPRTRQLIREATDDRFVAFLGYEWHSSEFGDYCLLFPEDQPELFLPDHVEKLFDFARARGALAIPHHVAYKWRWRGLNWDWFRPDVTPVVEIFSEHGCTESDRSPYPMILHSNGGRSTSQTIEAQLLKGRRFGFVASTDDHFGYPGAWGEGVVGVWAEELSPRAIFEAIRARRTVAASGDRIAVELTLNDRPMGSELPFTDERALEVFVEGQDSVEMIELIRGGRVIERSFPQDFVHEQLPLPGRARCRLQYGWGPWAALDLARICEWDLTVRIEHGRFHDARGCFQSGPFDEELHDRVRLVSEREVRLQSFTSRRQAFLEDPTKAIVLDLEADPEARLTVELSRPAALKTEAALRDLAADNRIEFTGVFTTESFVLHRPVSPAGFTARVRWQDRRSSPQEAPPGGDWYYARVRQHNGQVAWSSPIWVG